MKTNKGFVPLLIVLVVAIVAGGGIYYYSKQDIKIEQTETKTTGEQTSVSTTTPIVVQKEIIKITSPQANAELTLAKPLKVTWTSDSSVKKVRVSLNTLPEGKARISTDIENTGSYTIPAAMLTTISKWQITIADINNLQASTSVIISTKVAKCNEPGVICDF
jgi:hypothetical protein